jgi:predicted nuclease of predicted toxin-antitoxin system
VAHVLFDEGVPRQVIRAFARGEAVTIDRAGLKGVENGELLSEAEARGFAVLLTADKNMRHQNSLAGRRLAVVVLPYGNWPALRGMLGEIAAAVAAARAGTFTEVRRP